MNYFEEMDFLDRLESLKDSEWGTEMTPVQPLTHNGHKMWVKRDDMFERAGVRGGKVRSAWFLCTESTAEKPEGLCTAGSKSSPQINIIAHIAQELNLPYRAHCPSGELGVEVQSAKNLGAEIVQHRPGYNTVIVARAREDAEERGWLNVPFGMECDEAVLMTALQVGNLPGEVETIVMPIGSAMSFCGVLWGLELFELTDKVRVVGVKVGAKPDKRIEKYAPMNYQDYSTILQSPLKYEHQVEDPHLGNQVDGDSEKLVIDPIYEGKCIEFLEEELEGNPDNSVLFWIVGLR